LHLVAELAGTVFEFLPQGLYGVRYVAEPLFVKHRLGNGHGGAQWHDVEIGVMKPRLDKPVLPGRPGVDMGRLLKKIGSFDRGLGSCNGNGEWCCFLAVVVRLVGFFWVFGFLGVGWWFFWGWGCVGFGLF
jgi:hypothetical protein